MPGNFKSIVVFPFEFENARSARVQIEPFVCSQCYGMLFKVILELTGGTGNNTFIYERVAFEDALTQENIKDGFMSAPFVEVMEGFYFNKTESTVLVPVCAMILRVYYEELLSAFKINLDSYIIDVEYAKEELGFKSKATDNVSNSKTNKSSYKESSASITYIDKGDDKEKDPSNCRQIIKSLCQKNQRFKIRS